jgi:hypothetical protein
MAGAFIEEGLNHTGAVLDQRQTTAPISPDPPGRLDGKPRPPPAGFFFASRALANNSAEFRTIQVRPKDLPTCQRHSCERSMPELEQEDTMDTITQFTIAAAFVAFLLVVACHISIPRQNP